MLFSFNIVTYVLTNKITVKCHRKLILKKCLKNGIILLIIEREKIEFCEEARLLERIYCEFGKRIFFDRKWF